MVPSCSAEGALAGVPTSGTLLFSNSPSLACSLLTCSRNSSSCLRISCAVRLEESDWAQAAAGRKATLSKAAVKDTSLRFFTAVHLSSGIWLASEPLNANSFARYNCPVATTRVDCCMATTVADAQGAKTVLARQLSLLTVRRRNRVGRLPARRTIGLTRRPMAVLRQAHPLGQ